MQFLLQNGVITDTEMQMYSNPAQLLSSVVALDQKTLHAAFFRFGHARWQL